ncbi:hypothetical protein [Polyangium jinanense]|uniref:Lipoprotein n=1 Tax=Polyangium jinanense TaxID=2829994 RepID=A0A9X3XAT8_9BACT|nr:hypothetical protein [Polyangium jinanense]MDC3961688.1 hypothetical protein [Polyangium jinanense]MDC3983925.1 hypothetical protein [Polyangium jinanense]MDC3987264.1 hypothetical protein [Polyangium jinanense]
MRRSFLLAALTTAATACATPTPSEPRVAAPAATTNTPADPAPETTPAAEAPDAACPPGKAEDENEPACVYAAIVKRIPRRLDIDRAIEPYAGNIMEVKKAYDDDFAVVHSLSSEFDWLAVRPEPRVVSIRARIQQAALYDVLRQRLAGAEPPRVKLYTDKEEELLDKAATSGDPNLASMSQELRRRREEMFQSARENWLQATEAALVRHYADALLRARAWSIQTPEIDRARARIRHWSELLGDAKIKAYTEGLVDPANGKPFVYTPGALETP